VTTQVTAADETSDIRDGDSDVEICHLTNKNASTVHCSVVKCT